MSASTVSKCLLSCAFALGIALASPVSIAQTGTRDEIRAIEREYARQNGGRSISDEQLEYYLDRSHAGWPMSRITQDMSDYRRASPDNAWRAQQGWAATAVVCSSIDNAYRECPVPFRGHAVVSQQISDSACVEGRSWGQKQGMVWVNRGCRARFAMVPDTTAAASGRPGMVCKSKKGERRVCNTGIDGRIRLVNRFKKSGACIEGRTWGQRGNQVWVSDNCRARFAAAYGNAGAYPDRDGRQGRNAVWARDPNYSVTCSSIDSQQRCKWDTRYGSPRLSQRFSKTSCVEGRNWGYTARDGLWTSGGCRASFAAR